MTFFYVSGINPEGAKHVMIDEFFGDFDSFTEGTQEEFRKFISDKTTVWMALSNSYFGNTKKLPTNVDIEAHLKSKFPPGFEVAKMDKPLRSPLSVTKHMRDQVLERGKGGHLTLNEMFLQNSTLPANLAEGSVTSFGQMVPELLGQSLQKVFDTVRDSFAMLIIDDRPTFVNNLMEGQISSDVNCKGKLVVLNVLAALHSIGRYNTIVHTKSISNKIEDIIDCISGVNRQVDLYIPSTINTGYILWHQRLVVAVLAYFDPSQH